LVYISKRILRRKVRHAKAPSAPGHRDGNGRGGDVPCRCQRPERSPEEQRPAEAEVTGSTAVPASDIKNGNVTITTQTNPPTTPIAGAPDCPNANWTENITDLAFTSATITVFQDSNKNGVFDPGELVLTVSCTFNSPTSNGRVPASNYTCTES